MHRTRRARAIRTLGAGTIFLLLLAGAPTSPAGADPAAGKAMLWVTKTEPHLWLLGTCDLPDGRAQRLPSAAEKAFGECGTFLTALPSSSDDAARMEKQIRRLSALDPAAGGLRKVLGDRLDGRVYRLVPEITTLESREPWYLRRLAIRAHLASVYPRPATLLTRELWDRATQASMKTAGLDTVPEYLDAFDGLELKDQVTWLRHTLDLYDKDKDAKPTREERMVRAYLAGDVEKVQALWREGLPEGDLGKKLARTLLEQRVTRMLGRLAMRLKHEHEKGVFLAVDASLLAGPKGVLAQLKAAGQEMQRVP
jgi:uncharacterized protein YbaP (TraB family)